MPRLKDAFLNYFPIGHIPLLKKIQTTKFREMFSPEEREARYQEYRASVGFGKGLANTDAAKKYEENRVDSLDKLYKLKTGDDKSEPIKIDGKTVLDRLNKNLDTPGDAASAALEVKAAFATALELKEETKLALKNFEEEMKAINEIIKENPPKFSLSAIAGRLQVIRKDLNNALEKQQKLDIQQTTALFDAPMADKIKLGMGKAGKQITEDQFTSLKTDTIKNLEKNEERKAADKSMDEEINNLHKQAQTERDRISFLASLYENSEFMKKMIDELHAKELKRLKDEGLSDDEIVMAMGPEMIKSIANTTLKNIGIGDLTQIETETGLRINVGKDDKGEINFSVQLPIVYNKERYLATMTALAMSCKACGHEHCTITIDEKDEETALKAARLAYEAQAIAGYPPEKRHIVINGKTKNLGELFPNTKDNTQNTKLGVINAMYERNQKKTTDPLNRSPLDEQGKHKAEDEQRELRAAIQKEREKQNEARQDPGLDPNNPDGGLTL